MLGDFLSATAKLLTKYRDSTQAQFADDILKIADGSRQTGRPWGYHTTCSKLHAKATNQLAAITIGTQ